LILIFERPKRMMAMLCPIARGARALRCEQVIATYPIGGVFTPLLQRCILSRIVTNGATVFLSAQFYEVAREGISARRGGCPWARARGTGWPLLFSILYQ
jgi:hypothetical protein